MYQFPIGAMLDSFKLETKEAVKKAAEIGAKGLQMYSTSGENSPENLTGEKRKELLDYVKSHGLVFSAICGDLGMGFWQKELNPELIEKSKRIMDLAKELETNVVTTHIGVVPEDKNHDRYKIMQEACVELARYADSIGSHFAIETGPETSMVLKEFLDSLGSKGVAVNFDPANLIMITGDDPVQAVYNLKDYIVHTHAKDGNRFGYTNPEQIYGIISREGLVKQYKEMPLGTGSVPFPAYMKALEDIGYKGFLTIEREVGDDPAADIQTAVNYLNDIISNN